MKQHCAMCVDLASLKQQSWRAPHLFDEMDRYARSIGCTVTPPDEIECHTDKQAQLLAAWWRQRI
jgi:hypothetical protein